MYLATTVPSMPAEAVGLAKRHHVREKRAVGVDATVRLTDSGVSCAASFAGRSRSGAAVAAEELDERLADCNGRDAVTLAMR